MTRSRILRLYAVVALVVLGLPLPSATAPVGPPNHTTGGVEPGCC